MSFGQRIGTMLAYFSIATVLAEAGLLAVLGQRGTLNAQTMQNLLTIAYDVPLRKLHDEFMAKAQPVKKEMVSFVEVQEARMLTVLDLDLRQMASDKGSVDMAELKELLNQERGRYSVVTNQFSKEWEKLRLGATDTAVRDLQLQIESLSPKAAKDQLLRILDSPEVPPETARNQVVTIFKNLSVDKRKKIVGEFKDTDSQRLQDILRQIRLGMPEIDLLRDARVKLQDFQEQE